MAEMIIVLSGHFFLNLVRPTNMYYSYKVFFLFFIGSVIEVIDIFDLGKIILGDLFCFSQMQFYSFINRDTHFWNLTKCCLS